MSDTTPKNLANFIWQVADLLRGDYKRADYGKVILPFTVLRRLECVLEPTRADVLEEKAKWEAKDADPAPYLPKRAGELVKLGVSGAGGLANNLPTTVVKDLPIPIPPLDVQRQAGAAVGNWSTQRAKAAEVLLRQLGVLAERRQALIAAAVTGQIDVTTARGVDVS